MSELKKVQVPPKFISPQDYLKKTKNTIKAFQDSLSPKIADTLSYIEKQILQKMSEFESEPTSLKFHIDLEPNDDFSHLDSKTTDYILNKVSESLTNSGWKVVICKPEAQDEVFGVTIEYVSTNTRGIA